MRYFKCEKRVGRERRRGSLVYEDNCDRHKCPTCRILAMGSTWHGARGRGQLDRVPDQRTLVPCVSVSSRVSFILTLWQETQKLTVLATSQEISRATSVLPSLLGRKPQALGRLLFGPRAEQCGWQESRCQGSRPHRHAK